MSDRKRMTPERRDELQQECDAIDPVLAERLKLAECLAEIKALRAEVDALQHDLWMAKNQPAALPPRPVPVLWVYRNHEGNPMCSAAEPLPVGDGAWMAGGGINAFLESICPAGCKIGFDRVTGAIVSSSAPRHLATADTASEGSAA